jgi:hypothetical protein
MENEYNPTSMSGPGLGALNATLPIPRVIPTGGACATVEVIRLATKRRYAELMVLLAHRDEIHYDGMVYDPADHLERELAAIERQHPSLRRADSPIAVPEAGPELSWNTLDGTVHLLSEVGLILAEFPIEDGIMRPACVARMGVVCRGRILDERGKALELFTVSAIGGGGEVEIHEVVFTGDMLNAAMAWTEKPEPIADIVMAIYAARNGVAETEKGNDT